MRDWFARSLLTNILLQYPVLPPNQKKTLMLHSDPQAKHPFSQKISLLFCHLSGMVSSTEEFQRASDHNPEAIQHLLTKIGSNLLEKVD